MKKVAILLGLFALITCSMIVMLRPAPVQRNPHDEPKPFNQVIIHNEHSRLPVWHPDYHTAESVIFEEGEPDDAELEGVQCPIPMKDRVKNYTGIQCVFASLECIGRWADIKNLMDPPLTSRPDCKSYSGPSDAAEKLRKYGVKFEQSYRDRAKGIALIKKAMADGRGCLWGVPGHAMVLVHYDEEKKIVKYINNSNHKLPIQTMSMDEFNRRWDTWVIVVYNDPDPFPDKAGRVNWANQIPILDHNNPQGKYDKKYIPMPQK